MELNKEKEKKKKRLFQNSVPLISADPEKFSFSSSRTFGNPLKTQRTHLLLNPEHAKEDFVRSINARDLSERVSPLMHEDFKVISTCKIGCLSKTGSDKNFITLYFSTAVLSMSEEHLRPYITIYHSNSHSHQEIFLA